MIMVQYIKKETVYIFELNAEYIFIRNATSILLCCFCCTFLDTVDVKRLAEQIQALKKEKDDALIKVSEFQKQVS